MESHLVYRAQEGSMSEMRLQGRYSSQACFLRLRCSYCPLECSATYSSFEETHVHFLFCSSPSLLVPSIKPSRLELGSCRDFPLPRAVIVLMTVPVNPVTVTYTPGGICNKLRLSMKAKY